MDILNKIGSRVIQFDGDLSTMSDKFAEDDVRLNFLEYYCTCVYEYNEVV